MRLFAATALACLAVAGCGYEPTPQDGTLIPSDINGLAVSAKVSDTAKGFTVDARIENRRERPLLLEPDACGRAASAVLVRAAAQERGRTWSRSVQRVKGYVLERQTEEDRQRAPIVPAGRGCEPTSVPVAVAPGQVLKQRWIVERSPLLDEIGARHARVEVEVTEVGHRRPTAGAEGWLVGVVDWPARTHRTSAAEHFDRLLADPRLRRLLGREPADAWRGASLTVSGDRVVLTALSARYRSPFTATAGLDGGPVRISAPRARPGGSPDLPWA